MALSPMTLDLGYDQGPYAQRRARIRAWIDRLEPDVIGIREALRLRDFDPVEDLLEDRPYRAAYAAAASRRRPRRGLPRRLADRGRRRRGHEEHEPDRRIGPNDPFGPYAEPRTEPLAPGASEAR